MGQLEDDIARIAALRGRQPEELLERARRGRFPERHEAEAILRANPNVDRDLDWYDRLPAKSREFIRSQTIPLNAAAWYSLLHETGNEDEIIKAVTYLIPPPRRP